jgi:anti-sigma-K factor RskA
VRDRPKTRYVIKGREGQELVCPSLADLHALYSQGFLSDEDLVRMEGSQRWVAAGSMAALRGVRERKTDLRKAAIVLAAAVVLTLALALLMRGLR